MSMNKSKVAEIRKQKSLTQENLAEKAYVTVRNNSKNGGWRRS